MKIALFSAIFLAVFISRAEMRVANIEDESGYQEILTRVSRSVVKVCDAGEEFKFYCNTCRCNDIGNDFICTKNLCPDQPVVNGNIKCVPGKNFKVECNQCICNELGTDYHCSKNICPPPPPPQVVMKCEPGSKFKEGCNTCSCNAVGTEYACTRKVCPVTEFPPDDNGALTPICEPMQEFKMECNTCTCNSDGTGSTCTKRICPPSDQVIFERGPQRALSKRALKEKLTKCEPEKQFKIECNTCFCNKDGSDFACTKRRCPTN